MFTRRTIAFGLVAIAILAVVVFKTHVRILDTVANTVLANEVRFDDFELPRSSYAIGASADSVQLLGGQGGGLNCSLPWGAQALAFNRPENHAPIALQMRQACAFHDYCYRHGSATYGYSQVDCDFQLQQQVFRICKFILRPKSIAICETNARKVTLGVRAGGWGSFKRARAEDDEEASTFFEFDPYPTRSTIYSVLRIADAPAKWVADGNWAKAAYRFDVRPSGTRVRVYSWKKTGEMVCSGFRLPGSFSAINTPPMVVRDASGKDWFVWWKRFGLTTTTGEFAAMPAGSATPDDWAVVAGDFDASRQEGCADRSPWVSEPRAPDSPRGFVVEADFLFSQIQPVQGNQQPHTLRLVGLSNECDGLPRTCVVDVALDTKTRSIRREGAISQSIQEGKCGESRDQNCDPYRDHVSAPLITSLEGRPSLTWLRRGVGSSGEGFEDDATVYRFDLPAGSGAGKLSKSSLVGFSESKEPVAMLHAGSSSPTYMSLLAEKDQLSIRFQKAGSSDPGASPAPLGCSRIKGVTWLQRPAVVVPDPLNAANSYLILARTKTDRRDKQSAPVSDLDVAIVSISQDKVQAVHYAPFDDLFPEPAPRPNASAKAIEERKVFIASDDYRERLLERVRGGQIVVADLNMDGVPDLLQMVELPKTSRAQAQVLLGSTESGTLRFKGSDRRQGVPRDGVIDTLSVTHEAECR